MTGQGMADIVLVDGAAARREPALVAVERPAQQGSLPDAIPSAEKAIDTANGPLPLSLPPGTALLRVSCRPYEGQDRFYLELQSDVKMLSTAWPQDLRSQGRPDLTLAQSVAEGAWPQSFHKLRSWSVNKLTLRRWLTALRREHGRQLRLIIWDETDFQIPWELFYHETDNPDDLGWLGADIEVIRWTTVYSETPVDWSTGGSSTCHGPILGFIDPDFPSPDLLLSRYRYEQASSMQDLLTKLDDKSREVGFVYVWGHGILGSNGEVATLPAYRWTVSASIR